MGVDLKRTSTNPSNIKHPGKKKHQTSKHPTHIFPASMFQVQPFIFSSLRPFRPPKTVVPPATRPLRCRRRSAAGRCRNPSLRPGSAKPGPPPWRWWTWKSLWCWLVMFWNTGTWKKPGELRCSFWMIDSWFEKLCVKHSWLELGSLVT